ncbi:MAG: peptidoglycan endopeptidase [Spirochaetaceae bacterium]|nr:peptidoglycan endopeptidase [Spirochaetaceae bacterium]
MGKVNKKILFFFFSFALFSLTAAGTEPGSSGTQNTGTGFLESFADPRRIWGNGVEGLIEKAYRQCFKTYIIDGKIMNLRMPFAENHERDKLSDQNWEFLGGGKGNPAYLWEVIDRILDSEDFKQYTRVLGNGREKIIVFDISQRTWTVSLDRFDLARIKAGAYHGLPHKLYMLISGRGIEAADVYNYLYCVGWTGMDCSGFVWHVLSAIAHQQGLDLGRSLRRVLGVPQGEDPSYYVGTWFYNSSGPQIINVPDEIRQLRPGDILLFRGDDGDMVHSAIVQSLDFSRGIIRYLQSTDEAPLEERGVHESFIYFDPSRPGTSLKDPTLRWSQLRRSPFPGERASPFSDDGERYRAYGELGGGRVVRLGILNPPGGKTRR